MLPVRVGVAVIIVQGDKILLGKRKNSHGADTWAFPGGHLEFGETPEACAIRETQEETGLLLDKVIAGPWSNDVFVEANKHYITLFMLALYGGGEPKCMESDKCLAWEWFNSDALPSPLFLPIQNLLAQGRLAQTLKLLNQLSLGV